MLLSSVLAGSFLPVTLSLWNLPRQGWGMSLETGRPSSGSAAGLSATQEVLPRLSTGKRVLMAAALPWQSEAPKVLLNPSTFIKLAKFLLSFLRLKSSRLKSCNVDCLKRGFVPFVWFQTSLGALTQLMKKMPHFRKQISKVSKALPGCSAFVCLIPWASLAGSLGQLLILSYLPLL